MECRSMRSCSLVMMTVMLSCLHAPAMAYTMWSTAASYLGTGELQGPGLGPGSPQPLFCMNIRHLMFTTYTDLVVPFENNGAEPPNIVGELQVPGDLDGRLSDGSLINENVNTCAAVIAGRRVLPAVVQGGMHTGEVLVSTTSDGVFSMSMDFAIDLTEGHTVKLPLYGTVGEVTVPQSLQTQMGSKGVDQAGEYPSGTRLRGRIGDFNHDGWIDGTLVFVGVIPLDSPIAPGQPFVLVRNFETDIPVAGEWSGDVKSLKPTHGSVHRSPRQHASVAQLP
jgi:hypothetical protein